MPNDKGSSASPGSTGVTGASHPALSSTPGLDLARQNAERAILRCQSVFGADIAKFDLPPDAVIVAFGSLARRELTAASDVDFYVITSQPEFNSGQPVPPEFTRSLCTEAAEAAFGAAAVASLNEPGTSQMFGVYVQEHDLFQDIGLDPDHNLHMTRRVLLLAESVCLHNQAGYDRVLGKVLDAYVRERRANSTRPPRFLINDFVRYWRTLSVDFQAKTDDKARYGLRYLKLLVSRKFLFAATLFPLMLRDTDFWLAPTLTEDLLDEYRSTPQARLDRFVARGTDGEREGLERFRTEALSCLEEFNALVGDPGWRHAIREESASHADPRGCTEFAKGFAVQRRLDDALKELFFERPLADFTREFLVF